MYFSTSVIYNISNKKANAFECIYFYQVMTNMTHAEFKPTVYYSKPYIQK